MLRLIYFLQTYIKSKEEFVLLAIIILAICIEGILGVWSIYKCMKATKAYLAQEKISAESTEDSPKI